MGTRNTGVYVILMICRRRQKVGDDSDEEIFDKKSEKRILLRVSTPQTGDFENDCP